MTSFGPTSFAAAGITGPRLPRLGHRESPEEYWYVMPITGSRRPAIVIRFGMGAEFRADPPRMILRPGRLG